MDSSVGRRQFLHRSATTLGALSGASLIDGADQANPSQQTPNAATAQPARPAHTYNGVYEGARLNRVAFLMGGRQMWPRVKASLDYCITTWDPDHKDLLEEPHHNTFDIECWGPDGMCTSFYLGLGSIQLALDDQPIGARVPTTGPSRRRGDLRALGALALDPGEAVLHFHLCPAGQGDRRVEIGLMQVVVERIR